MCLSIAESLRLRVVLMGSHFVSPSLTCHGSICLIWNFFSFPRLILWRPSFLASSTRFLRLSSIFFPLSRNLIFPLDCSMPEIRYMDGDWVSLTFVEDSFDFDNLSGNHKRNEIDFHPLAVQMSSTTFGPLIVPLLAIQVTLFRNSAICIGFTFHHIAGDAIGMGSYLKPKSGLKHIWALNQPARSTPDMKLLIDLSNKWLLQPAF